jgi:hypothetical protein
VIFPFWERAAPNAALRKWKDGRVGAPIQVTHKQKTVKGLLLKRAGFFFYFFFLFLIFSLHFATKQLEPIKVLLGLGQISTQHKVGSDIN